MAYYKLKEEHPVTQKVRKLEQLMDDMGLQITVGHNDQLIIRSDETNEYYEYRDIEQSVTDYQTTVEFPAAFETKLVVERDD